MHFFALKRTNAKPTHEKAMSLLLVFALAGSLLRCGVCCYNKRCRLRQKRIFCERRGISVSFSANLATSAEKPALHKGRTNMELPLPQAASALAEVEPAHVVGAYILNL